MTKEERESWGYYPPKFGWIDIAMCAAVVLVCWGIEAFIKCVMHF